MDKYEYKVRADEIKALIADGEFAEAVKIADTIDWRRVRSVMMLCTISDLYKINRRYRESKDILLLAYEKHPNGRLIVYSLCELSIKMGEFDQAVEYCKEFVQIAPKDTGRYILQYKLYEAQDVSLEERIAVLEEFKKRDYREKWAYELAYLYHRIGLSTKCVEECDEMFLWFGEGKYVIKALELKALHEPLNAEQQARYDEWLREKDDPSASQQLEEEIEEDDGYSHIAGDTRVAGEIRHSAEHAPQDEQAIAEVPTTELPEVKPIDVGQYNTMNLQRELAESMKELLEGENEDENEDTPSIAEAIIAPLLQKTEQIPAAGEEALEEEQTSKKPEAPPQSAREKLQREGEELLRETEELLNEPDEEFDDTPTAKPVPPDTDELKEIGAKIAKEYASSHNTQQIIQQIKQESMRKEAEKSRVSSQIPGAKTGTLTPLNTQPSEYDKILSQEYDGQISFVLPDAEHIEKQITGQLSIDDIMAEWEEMKKTNEQKRMEDVRQHILAQTGSLFANFDEETKNGLLEELEKAFLAAIMKESEKPPIKEVILPEDVNENIMTPKREAAKPVVRHETPVAKEPPIEEEEAEEDLTGTDEEDTEESAVETESEDTVSAETKKTLGGDGKAHTAAVLNSDRDLTVEEQELFGKFVHHRKARQQLVNTLDNMSLASCTGNVIITGEEEDATLELAKGLIREMQLNDGNFSGKVAKIAGAVLNKKNVAETFARLDNGALIIEKAAGLKPQTIAKMGKVLDQDSKGLLVLMTDKKQKINKLLADNASISDNFNLRVEIEPLNDEALVEYAKQYAEEMEYSIDEFGILALHTRIADKQTSDHEVNLSEVRDLVDEAIYYANKKTPKHFVDILLAKRYDEEDMIILREKDFMH